MSEWIPEKKIFAPPDEDPADQIEIHSTETEVEVNETAEILESPKSQSKLVAERIVDLVKAGDTPAAAARKVSKELSKFMSRREITAAIEALVEGSALSAELRKAGVRAALNHILLSNIQDPSPKSQKLALEAAKEIARDPEVGLTQEPPGVNIDLGSLGELLERTEPIPGTKPPREQER